MLAIPPRLELFRHPIDGPRVSLQAVDPQDSSEYWSAIDGSRDWLKPWLPWVPYQTGPEACVRFTQASCQDWDSGRALRFTVRDKETRAMLGVVGLETCVAMHRSCELGYWLRREAAGKGYMTEAARVCVHFAFRTLGIHRLKVAAATANHASLSVISRLGFQFEGIARHAEWCDGRWLDHALFSMLEYEWRN